jgi:DNA-binding CsgD family transcriptional regulator
MTASRDLVGVIEAAYRLDGCEQTWLERVTASVQPCLDRGLGVGAFYFKLGAGYRLSFTRPIVLGASRALAAALPVALRATPRKLVKLTFGAPTSLGTASSWVGWGPAFARHPLAVLFGHPYGVRDLLNFKVLEPDGRGLFFASALPNVDSASPRDAEAFSQCAAHLRSALRLRRALSGARPGGTEQAVFDVNGRCLHAEGEAREPDARSALREAVLRAERARGRLRRTEGSEALALWQALVDGRWSLVERFESEGRRYLVAHENALGVRDPRGLTVRERQVAALAALGHSHKLIAYELGLSRPSVTASLNRAMRKLGAGTQAELLTWVRGAV